MHELHMRHSGGPGVANHGRIGKSRDQPTGRQMVDENLIRATAGGPLAVFAHRDGVDWVDTRRQRLPMHWGGLRSNVAGCTLVDPALQQTELD